MSRPNYIDFAEYLYRFDIELEDWQIQSMLFTYFGIRPSLISVSTWKSHIRKKGLKIPDRRKTKKGESND